jgi:hypothetical protein
MNSHTSWISRIVSSAMSSRLRSFFNQINCRTSLWWTWLSTP